MQGRRRRDQDTTRQALHGASVGLLTTLGCLLVSACTVGPDFKRPATPEVSDYLSHPAADTVSSPTVAGGEAQSFAKGANIPADWWTLFHSKPLNDLIEQSLANNHDLKAAQAALAVARETVLAQRGVYYPNVSGSFSVSRQRQSGVLAPTPITNASEFSLITPEVSVSYALDVFGLNRRTTENVKAQAEAVRYQMLAARLTLTSNVAAAAIQDASLRAQIDATRELITADGDIVQILRYQRAKGYASGLDVAAQEALQAQAAATLPPLVKQDAQQRDLLAVLAGRPSSQAPEQHIDLASLTLPQEVPVSLPSALVNQRPDVLQAQANMHAASAQIGVAIANRLPQFQLTANAGNTALAFGQLFSAGTGFWGLAANAATPIFDGGALLHQERGAKAAYVESSEQYRNTLLTAFQNVADTLTALQQDAEALKATAAAEAAAKTTLDLSQRQWRDGYAPYLSVLTAEQAYQQARIGLVQAQANRYADTVALFQALGGGWWNRADLVQGQE
jgi:NodT family efflux transporter outer membrane factor (OMF) lipoprotein